MVRAINVNRALLALVLAYLIYQVGIRPFLWFPPLSIGDHIDRIFYPLSGLMVAWLTADRVRVQT